MNTTTQVEKLINDIALLATMVEPKDSVGIEAILTLLENLLQLDQVMSEFPQLGQAAKSLQTKRADTDPAAFIALIHDFTSSAQSLVVGGAANAFTPADSSWDPAHFGPHFDEEFLTEFIEKHSLLLEEFEGSLLDAQFNTDIQQSELDALKKQVKSYLHNIKGDAGSIGLVGIEQVTHALEDMVDGGKITDHFTRLISYKEWVVACIRAISKGQSPTVAPARILQALNAAVHGTAPATPPAENPIQSEPRSVPVETTAPYPVTGDASLVSEFVAEAGDHISSVESILLECGQELKPDEVDTVFRAVHSLKGASSYFGLKEINITSHRLESIFDEVRTGARAVDQGLLTLVFAYIDITKELLQAVTEAYSHGSLITPNPEVDSFLEALDHYAAGKPVQPAAKQKTSPPPPATIEEQRPMEQTLATAATPPVKAQPPEVSAPADRRQETPRAEGSLAIKTFVKIETSRLDRLIDSIGEMVIYSSMLIQHCRDYLGNNEKVVATTHQVEKFSRDLQDIGMSMRLDPVKGLFQKLSRLVWDLAQKTGKEIHFTMKGEDTEVDRTVIEKLSDPLMHMVRNAIDHGIEPPDERRKAGKPPSGSIELSASHVGGNIVIEINDDGRGLDTPRILAKAIEKGIVPAHATLSPSEIRALIFAPGFSTATQVTDISGRGVGMDVVRSNIESIRGRIQIDSEIGKGTRFTIELPLTLAIIDGVETRLGEERYIFPTLSIAEFIHPSSEMIATTMGHGETFCFRGHYIPLFHLRTLFGAGYEATSEGPMVGAVVIVENGGEYVAFMVDEIRGHCQTVIKNLGPLFEDRHGLAGCAIMPDGSIAVILDVRTLVAVARNAYSPRSLNGAIGGWADSTTVAATAFETQGASI